MVWGTRHILGATILLGACDSPDFDIGVPGTDSAVVTPDGSEPDAVPGPDGTPLPTGKCGDGNKTAGEVCDDSNLVNGDGCNPTCTLANNVTTFATGLGMVPSIVVEGGALYVADTSSFKVRRYDIATKMETIIAGTGIAGYVDNVAGVAAQLGPISSITSDGKSLFIMDNRRVRAISLTSPYAVTTIAGAGVQGFSDGTGAAAQFDDPRGLTYLDNYLYFVESARPTMRRVDPNTKNVATIAGSASTPGTADGCGPTARFQSPRYLAADRSGVLYVSDTLGPTVRVFRVSDKCVTTIAGAAGKPGYVDGSGLTAQFTQPRGLVTDGSNLYVLDFPQHALRQFELGTASVTTNAGKHCGGASCTGGNIDGVGTAARFNGPMNLAFDPATRSLFVADTMNAAIRRVQ